jgi:hypothetical protein
MPLAATDSTIYFCFMWAATGHKTSFFHQHLLFLLILISFYFYGLPHYISQTATSTPKTSHFHQHLGLFPDTNVPTFSDKVHWTSMMMDIVLHSARTAHNY